MHLGRSSTGQDRHDESLVHGSFMLFDVAIYNGFEGRVVLRLTEVLAKGLFRIIDREFNNESPEPQMRSMERLA